MFKDRAGSVVPKLGEFERSTIVKNHEPIHVPRNFPWSAPEFHYRGFTPEMAKKSDVYSYSLLCLWIIFENELEKLHSDLSSGLGSSSLPQWFFGRSDCFFEPPSSIGFLRQVGWGQLPAISAHLVTTAPNLNEEQRYRLGRFFESSLHHDPEQRPDFAYLVDCLVS